MKFIWAAIAVLAAVAALIVLPPHRAPNPIATSPARSTDLQSHNLPKPVPPILAAEPRQNRIVVYVAGQVRKPGVYTLTAGMRGVDALARAGGPLPDADLVAVNLAAPLADGDEIAVPNIGGPSSRRHSTAPRLPHRLHPKAHRQRRKKQPAVPAKQSIDLNRAVESDLEDVPGIGPGLAARIIGYRETNGAFSSIDELADVAGITPRLQDLLAQFVFVR